MRAAILVLAVVLMLLPGVLSGPSNAAANPPGIDFDRLLRSFDFDCQTGKLGFNDIYATFLPKDEYPEFEGSGLWAIVRKADGSELFKLDLHTGTKFDNVYLGMSYDDAKVLGGGAQADGHWMLMNATGDYSLDFYLDGAKFYAYPFSISAKESDNAFTGGTMYFLEGAWGKWAYLLCPYPVGDNTLTFEMWLRSGGRDEKNTEVKVKLYSKKDGSLICLSYPGKPTLYPEWRLDDFPMVSPPKPDGTYDYYLTKDLLAKNGDYVIKVSLDDQPYGQYDFSVAGGKFSYAGRTLRGQADPLTFIEGGLDKWWYERK